jgi:hypothetical protein
MKTILLVYLLAISVNVFSQSILSDKRDVATNMRTITTGTNPLHKSSFSKTVEVQSQLRVQNDSITSYDLNLTAPDTSAENFTASTCSLETEDGTVVTGSSIAVNKFRFSKEDFYKLISNKITQIKITTNNGKEKIIKVSENMQDILSKQAKAMLLRLRANNSK